MKKILFFETQDFTGATRVTRTLAKAARENYEVAFAQVGNNLKEEIESAIEKVKPDILFSSFIHINPDVISVGKNRGLYVVIRNDYKLQDVAENVRKMAEESYPLADEIIVQTEEMQHELLHRMHIKPAQITILENPLDEEDILEKSKAPTPFLDNGNFHFLWVGRKDPIKDIPTLERAFEIVHKIYPKTDLTFISDDPNPYKWMKNSDCLVISSISEASPNVLREALFLGISVISTDCSPTVRSLLPREMICSIKDAKALAGLMKKVYLLSRPQK